jgi:crossover junction endodeoxyribonuclease RuvC
MRIIGIDPGLTKTGVGIIEVKNNSLSFVACETIYSDAAKPLAERLQHFHLVLTELIKKYQPQQAAIEETFVNTNPVSSLKLGQARGALILTLSLCNLPVFEYAATSIKKTVVGVGRADKNQIKAMVKILLPKAVFNSEDEADALAIALCHNSHATFRKSYS